MLITAKQPSEITLPAHNQGWPTVLAFLCAHFPRIPAELWQQRIRDGKVYWYQGEAISELTPFLPSRRLCYFREVAAEPKIPFLHQILYQDAHLLVADKPHFLPVTPGGDFVNECLLQRLKEDTWISDLAPLHRLDRDTAGLVLFSCNSQSRPHYYQLFQQGQLVKRYQARARLNANLQPPLSWRLSNRIEKAQPRFINQIVPGEANAHSIIELVGIDGDIGQFQLQPLTGKTHQLRLHMLSIGMPILNDAYYPQLLPKNTSDFSRPLQLLAQQLSFIDPLSKLERHFVSQQRLF